MKDLILSVSLISSLSLISLSAHAEDAKVLKPTFQCQSQEFAIDDGIHAVVIQDPISGQTHVDVARTWFGGTRRSTYQVQQLINTGAPGAPTIFEGEGLRLAIQSTRNANEQYLAATLSTQIDERNTQDEKLICLPDYSPDSVYFF